VKPTDRRRARHARQSTRLRDQGALTAFRPPGPAGPLVLVVRRRRRSEWHFEVRVPRATGDRLPPQAHVRRAEPNERDEVAKQLADRQFVPRLNPETAGRT
jgi:hypothetical protein